MTHTTRTPPAAHSSPTPHPHHAWYSVPHSRFHFLPGQTHKVTTTAGPCSTTANYADHMHTGACCCCMPPQCHCTQFWEPQVWVLPHATAKPPHAFSAGEQTLTLTLLALPGSAARGSRKILFHLDEYFHVTNDGLPECLVVAPGDIPGCCAAWTLCGRTLTRIAMDVPEPSRAD